MNDTILFAKVLEACADVFASIICADPFDLCTSLCCQPILIVVQGVSEHGTALVFDEVDSGMASFYI